MFKAEIIEFYEFIYERQLAWYNRFIRKNPRPWSGDEILNKYKFCNVYRELDRCSIHLLNTVINNDKLENIDKVFNILLFRIFNVDKFFTEYLTSPVIFSEFKFLDAEKLIDEVKSNGKKVFNNAYNITQATYFSGHRKRDKHSQHLQNLENIAKTFRVTFKSIEDAKSPREIFEILRGLNFFGPFLAYQCLIDISYIPNFLYLNWNDFVNVGPGAIGTIDAIFEPKPRGITPPKHYEAKCKELFYEQKNMFYKLRTQFNKNWLEINFRTPYNAGDYLSLNNIQNCCCEFRKYLNYKNDTKCRVKYFYPTEGELEWITEKEE